MADAEEAKTSAPANPTDSIRAVAKWLIGAFAAVGAVFLAGVQISNLRSTDSTDEVLLAGLGIALGMTGVIFAVMSTARVMLPAQVSLAGGDESESSERIEKWAQGQQHVFGGYGTTVAEVYARYVQVANRALELRKQAEASTVAADRQRLIDQLEAAEDEQTAIAERLEALHKQAVFLEVGSRFNAAKFWVPLGSALIVVGATVFAIATTKAESEPAVAQVFVKPAAVTLDLEGDDFARVRKQLGSKCPVSGVKALALDGDSKDGYDVLVLETENCNSLRLTMPASSVADL